jgi:DNA-binding NarL/FixJ family response regulator
MPADRPAFDVVIAHPSPLTRKLVARALVGCPGVRRVVEAATAAECAALCERLDRGLALVDAPLASDAVLARLTRAGVTVLVIARRGWADDPRVRSALRAGARGAVVAPASFLEADEAAPALQRRLARTAPAALVAAR